MKVYYAHPLNLYNTKQEERDLATLAAIFGAENIINPNNDAIHALYKVNYDMTIFYNLVKSCDVIAFRGTPFGKITAGVAAEVKVAQEYGTFVIELPAFVGRAMSVDQTREYLKEIGQR